MKPAPRVFLSACGLLVALLACRGPFRPQPTVSPADSVVATRVAATVAAQAGHSAPTGGASPTAPAAPTPSAAPTGQPTPGSTPAPATLLPHSLYFIARDPGGRDQVWRLAADGIQLSQVTSEPVDVTEFDVSTDGDVAYLANNQLLLVGSDGAGRKIIVDGGPNDNTDSWAYYHQIRSPRWSPDGRSLAFAQNGVSLFDPTGASSTLLIPNDIDNQDGFPFPRNLYAPLLWSPDGSQLLLEIGHYEAADKAVYNIASQALVALATPNQPSVCCSAAWSPDGTTVFAAGYYYGGMSSELWRYDATTGAGDRLIAETSAADGTYNFAEWPHALPDGNLLYFFGNQPESPSGSVPLLLVRSAADGVTGRSALRPEKVLLVDALWSPSGHLAVTVQPSPGEPTYPPRGPLVVVFADGRPNQAIAPDGRTPRWGP